MANIKLLFLSLNYLSICYSYHWGGKGSGRNPCQETYGGKAAFSEPETNAIRRYITVTNERANWRAYVSFHSYGQYILYPWGYDRVVPQDYVDLERIARKAADVSKVITIMTYV